jgi:hypothetical protein
LPNPGRGHGRRPAESLSAGPRGVQPVGDGR